MCLANLERTRGLLANENFVNRAPPPVVEKEREKLGDLELRAQQISERFGRACVRTFLQALLDVSVAAFPGEEIVSRSN